MVEQSDKIEELLTALSLFQGELMDAKKDRVNPGASNAKYATLGSHWDAIREPLTKNGLSISQWPGSINKEAETIAITTILGHKSGQWQRSMLDVPLPKEMKRDSNGIKFDPQGMGIAITYARRYALSAATGTCPSDDEDGGTAGSSRPSQATQSAPSPPNDLLVQIAKWQKALKIDFRFPATVAEANTMLETYSKEWATREANKKSA